MIGIDPGQSGGIVKLSDTDSSVIFSDKFADKTEHDIAELIREYACSDIVHDHVWIEQVHGGGSWRGKEGQPRQQGAVSAFKFGDSFGFLKGCLVMVRVPFNFVTPQKWQKLMSCLTHGDKNVSKAAAQRLWPDHKWTHAIADAALIAEYGLRVRATQRAF